MWIESHQELAHHPKLFRLARHLEISKPCAIGHLHMLWWWTLSYAPDGDTSPWDAAELAAGAGWEGDPALFLAALQRAGFVDDDGTLHDWDQYGGKLLEKRKKEAARKKRARTVRGTSTGHPREVGQAVPGRPAEGASRQDDRREDNKTDTTPFPPLVVAVAAEHNLEPDELVAAAMARLRNDPKVKNPRALWAASMSNNREDLEDVATAEYSRRHRCSCTGGPELTEGEEDGHPVVYRIHAPGCNLRREREQA